MMQSLQCRGDPKCLLKSRGTNLFNIFFFFILDNFFFKIPVLLLPYRSKTCLIDVLMPYIVIVMLSYADKSGIVLIH